MAGAHDAPVRLGHGGLSTQCGGLGLRGSRGQRQKRLATTRAEVWQGELGAGQGDGHLEADRGTREYGKKIQRGKGEDLMKKKKIKLAFKLPVALQNWLTECCYSNYSGHAAAPALNTYLNADSSPVEPGGDIMGLVPVKKNTKEQQHGAHLQQVSIDELRAPHA